MFYFIKNLFKKPKFNPGAILDDREEKKDVVFSEIVAKANDVNWRVKPKSEWRSFPVFNQYYTQSCVAHSFSKVLGVYYYNRYGYFVSFSPSFIYSLRKNKPDGGMMAYDAWEILKNKGVALYELLPTPKTEIEINNLEIKQHLYDVANVFKISTEIVIDNYTDVETIASIIQTTNKAVSIWLYFDSEEFSRETPIILRNYNLYMPGVLRHAITAVDFTLNEKGEKCLICEDSAHFGNISTRLITENFLRRRCFYAAYFMNFKFEGENKIKYFFQKDLYLGMRDNDVKFLQDALKYEGCLASNIQSTGYFGYLTLEAVKKFQTKYNLPATGYVGEKTRNVLNQIFL